jgi:hypothetical protein
VLHLGWTNFAELLIVNLYFYIFNRQRFRAGRAMNSSPVASPASWQQYYRHPDMKKIFILIFICSFQTISCAFLEQNDFVLRKTLTNKNNESIFYEIHQTGLDNYTFTFFNAYESDTIKIFKYFLNDAVYTALRLETSIVNDTILVNCNMPSDDEVHKLLSGSYFAFRRSKYNN